jgi:hypothetical protein
MDTSAISSRSSLDQRQKKRPKDQIPAATRAAVAKDTAALFETDGRLRVARRFAAIARAIVRDRGGADVCSEAQRQLIKRFAAAAVLAEVIEGKLARGEPIDLAQHALLCSTLVRLSQRIGISRVPKQIEGLGSYLEREYAARIEPLEPELEEQIDG